MKKLDDKDLPSTFEAAVDFLRHSIGPVRASGSWCAWKKDQHSLPLAVELTPSAGQNFPAKSAWHLVVTTNVFPAEIQILPDYADGVQFTFPHQASVREIKGQRPWMAGHPCLSEPTDAWGDRYGSNSEPPDFVGRLIWHLERFSGWCLRAADGKLHNDGEHFELPPSPDGSAGTIIGFHETEQNFNAWLSSAHTSGIATLVEVSAPRRALAVQKWRTMQNAVIAEPTWGKFVEAASDAQVRCVWFRLGGLPLIEAWQLPRTYRELGEVLRREGIDLEDVFDNLGVAIRKVDKNAQPMMLLGFPIPHKFGDAALRMHWIAIQNIPLSKKNRIKPGFRGNEENRQKFDRQLARSNQKLNWAKCENWAPDQIRSRLRRQDFVPPSILLIGAGALGSQIAETLVRMGVVDIGIQDSDTLAAGNLCRHSLDLSSIGRRKADALAFRLNRLQADTRARHFDTAFPPMDLVGIQEVDRFDLILECTGDDDVLRALAAVPWGSDKIFISLSLGWGAQELLVWSSRGSAFPAIDAIERLGQLTKKAKPDESDVRIEGIGCWHPVFPADASDVQVWAGIAAKIVLEIASGGREKCGIYFYKDDGTVGYRHG